MSFLHKSIKKEEKTTFNNNILHIGCLVNKIVIKNMKRITVDFVHFLVVIIIRVIIVDCLTPSISKSSAVLSVTASKFGSTVWRLIIGSISLKEPNPGKLLKPFWIVSVMPADFHLSNTVFFPSALVIVLYKTVSHCAYIGFGIVSRSLTSISYAFFPSSSCWMIWLAYHSVNFFHENFLT